MNMNKLINNILLKERVQVILKRKTIECKLIFTVIEFMDKNNLYKSLTLAYNESDIFILSNKYLLPVKRNTDCSVSDIIRGSIKCYTNKSDLVANRQTIPDETLIEELFNKYEDNISSKLLMISTANFRVRKVLITWYPTITYVIHISFKNKFYKSLVYNYNQITVINEFILEQYKLEYKSFINKIFEELGEIMWI